MEQPDTILETVSWLAGGLGLFLFGIKVLSDSLRQAASQRMRRVLAQATRNPLIGLGVGATITACLQSSSATTVLVVSFVNAGLLTLQQSVGVIFGSGIGSTVTAQLIASNWVEAAALPAIGIGTALYVLAPRRGVRKFGANLLGFGLVFFGFIVMKEAVAHWQDTAIRSWFVGLGDGGALGILVGVFVAMIATAILQSSGATIGMVLVLAAAGALPDLQSAIPLVVGANVGTTATAVLAAIGTGVTAKRAAALHVVFRFTGAIIALVLWHLWCVVIPLTSDVVPRQIANFHTLFNLVNALVLLPFAGLFARAIRVLVPGREDITPTPLYLDFGRRASTEESLGQARAELVRISGLTRQMTHNALRGWATGEEALLETVLQAEEAVDTLSRSVGEFLFERSLLVRVDQPTLLFLSLHQVNHHIERVGDHAENIVESARLQEARGIFLPRGMRSEVLEFGEHVDELAALATDALRGSSESVLARANAVRGTLSEGYIALVGQCHAMAREEHCSPLSAVLYEDLLTNLMSTATHLRKVVRSLLDPQFTPEEDIVLPGLEGHRTGGPSA